MYDIDVFRPALDPSTVTNMSTAKRRPICIDVNIFVTNGVRVIIQAMNAPELPERVLQFVAQRIDTVPQLEALLLLWENSDRAWRAEEIAARVYVSRDSAALILRALSTRQLATAQGNPPIYRYSSSWDSSGTLMAEVAATYRRHLVPVSTFIHSGASSSVRDFARAFDLKKDRQQ